MDNSAVFSTAETTVRERADHEIDATGLICPEPLMVLRNKVRDVVPGEVIYVVATDPSTVRDFGNYCRFLNHELVAHEEKAGRYCYLIRKGAG